MLVGLGFAIATLLALVVTRLAWKAALRLAARRSRRNQPAALLELQAERDRLRAEHAMMARKLELKLEDLKGRLAEQTAEITRNRNRVDTLREELAARDGAMNVHGGELAHLRQQLASLEDELAQRATALDLAHSQLHERDEAIARLGEQIKGLNAEVISRDQELAELRAGRDRAGGPVIDPGIVNAQDRLTRRIEELTAMSREIAAQRAQLGQQPLDAPAPRDAGPTPEDELAGRARSLEQELAEAERESVALANELKRLDKAWAEKLEEADKAPAPPPPRNKPTASGAIANVVNLAARLRSLKSDSGG